MESAETVLSWQIGSSMPSGRKVRKNCNGKSQRRVYFYFLLEKRVWFVHYFLNYHLSTTKILWLVEDIWLYHGKSILKYFISILLKEHIYSFKWYVGLFLFIFVHNFSFSFSLLLLQLTFCLGKSLGCWP